MLWTTFLMALREIRRNTMRSLLTMLGVVIGVAAVIALVTIGQGTTQRVTNDIGKLGRNMLIVVANSGRSREPSPPFTLADVEAIRRELSGVRAVAPSAGSSAVVVFGNNNWLTSVTGSTNAYFDVRDHQVSSGRSFSAEEIAGGSPVCVIGETVKKELFGALDPLEASVRVGKISCRIIGVLDAKGTTIGSDQDDLLIMPLATFQRRISGSRDIRTVFVSAKDGRPTVMVKQQIEGLLRQRRRLGYSDDLNFEVRDVQDITDTLSSVTGALTALLGAIAAVSLLVGGIGIMNIMLVSVTERTREIGIRLAIGARAREVLAQFLVEAIVLSSLGGTIGIGLGLLGSAATTRALDMPLVIDPSIIVIAFVFSAAVGVIFGYLPARKAARLEPIDALRHE